MLTLVSISNAADDLPPRRSRRGASLWEQPSNAQLSILMSATTCRQLPALLTSVSNSIAGSVLPPSVCEGAFPCARGRFTSE